MLCFSDAFIDQSFIIAPPLVILVFAGSRWNFASG